MSDYQAGLFDEDPHPPVNVIKADGMVSYFGKLIDQDAANYYFNYLLKNIAWKNDEAINHGEKIITKRKVAWYGDKPFEYTYSNTTKRALAWQKNLLTLKEKVEHCTGETFNACLLNLYHDGSEGMAWHSDAEKALKRNGAIASLSFGAQRKFSFKHKRSKETVSLQLEHGSLLVMKGTTQSHWLHRLPPTIRVMTPRINLTFRTITFSEKH